MRRLLLGAGSTLIALGAAGIVFVSGAAIFAPGTPLLGVLRPDRVLGLFVPPPAANKAPPVRPPAGEELPGLAGKPVDPSPVPVPDLPAPPEVPLSDAPPIPEEPVFRPVSRVRLPQIRLESDVQVSRVVKVAAGSTWEVPPFKVGHGEYSAGAGQPGNVVLLGHLTSLDAGNVFRDLHLTRPGNVVQVFSGEDVFDYQVVDVRSVSRLDISWAQPTERPSVSLVTCAGAWLPAIQDYALRLVVRAELMQ